MTIRNLNLLFSRPVSPLWERASARVLSDLHVAENLLRGGFQGEIGFVNPGRDTSWASPATTISKRCLSRQGSRSWPRPPNTVPGIIAELGHKGCRGSGRHHGGPNRRAHEKHAGSGRALSYAYHRPQLPWHPDPELESRRELRAHPREARRHRACVSIGRDNGGHARLGGRRGRRVQSRRLDRGRWPTSIPATCSIISRATSRAGPFFFTSRRSGMRRSSCPRQGAARAPSP